MVKFVVDEADAQAVEGDRGLMPVSTVFDLASIHPAIPGGDEVDLEAVLAGLLSESCSITPTTMKEEAGVDPDQLAAALHAIKEQQKHKIGAMMDALSQEREENIAVYQRLEAESAAYEAARVGADISQAKTNAEIGAKNGELREARKVLDILVENFRSLHAMLEAWSSKRDLGERGDEDAGAGASSAAAVGVSSSAEHEVDVLVEAHDAGYDAPIMLKTYQQDAFEPESDDKYKEVRRFALVSENLRGMEGQALKSDILHPLEAILMHEAVAELQKSGDVPCGVVCDIFVRTEEDTISVATDRIGNLPETHSVALWKKNGKLYLIDSNSSKFSSSLIDEIQSIWGGDVIKSLEGVLYGNSKKPVGRVDGTSRDCIDMAVKIILELFCQIELYPAKSVDARLQNSFVQLSTENSFAKHFSKNSDRQIREFRATSSEVRHMALKIAKAL